MICWNGKHANAMTMHRGSASLGTALFRCVHCSTFNKGLFLGNSTKQHGGV